MSDMPVVIGATASVLRLDQRTLRVDFADGAFKRFPGRQPLSPKGFQWAWPKT